MPDAETQTSDWELLWDSVVRWGNSIKDEKSVLVLSSFSGEVPTKEDLEKDQRVEFHYSEAELQDYESVMYVSFHGNDLDKAIGRPG